MTSQEYIALRAANYAADSRITGLLTAAELEIGTSFGVNRTKALALLVLHWMAMDDRATETGAGSVGGSINLEQEGSLKRAYTVDFSLQHKYPDLTQTRWGMELISLTKRTTITLMTRLSTVQ